MFDPTAPGTLAIAGSAVAAVVVALLLARLRGVGTDPLESVARWATSRGLEYVPASDPARLAEFRGDVAGHGVEGRRVEGRGVESRRVEARRVEVSVERVARGFGVDLPPRVTVVSAAAAAGLPACTLQPAAWVLDTGGASVGPALATGDDAFDAAWAVRPDVPSAADEVARVVTRAVRERLLRPDAIGLAVRLAPRLVETRHPGIVTEVQELDRRLALVCDLASLLDA